MKKLTYSVVIALDRTDKELTVLKGLCDLPKEERPREIFACVGRNPSLQRNLGVEQCSSDVVYFLDDDSYVIPGTSRELLSHFDDTRTVVSGGPNLVPPNATSFEKSVSSVLASWLGSFKVRNRYAAIGSVKEATEKDLILCNMMVRRKAFLKEGGFRIDLFPNEENEFLNRLLHMGYRLVYDPRGAIYRSRRKSLQAYCYQGFRYGRGRARQIKVYPCLSDLVHLIPLFFLLYLLTLGLPWLVDFSRFPLLALMKTIWWWVPFLMFAALALGTGISSASWHRRAMDSVKVPILIFLRHFFYGLGLIAGFLMPIPVPPKEVRIFRVLLSKNSHHLIPINLHQPRNRKRL
jgi:cellulose synthase/poly-beta-1,6-N-acetylglucosamine synthase-like glycosyltransferase